MNVLMLTNTYSPFTGGVAHSVEWSSGSLRQMGHRVLVIAPTFEHMPAAEDGVVRVPALQQFNGSDFSVRLPIPGLFTATIEEFAPDIVHAHHPFLLGDTALRIAAIRNLPIVFTHHTMYEQYTHYVPGDSPAMQRFAARLATEFANLCDAVVAPSESVADILRDRGVTTRLLTIPTGIDTTQLADGDGAAARRVWGIPGDAYVVGHVGRLAPEKNLDFLSRAIARFMRQHPRAWFLAVGAGPSREAIHAICKATDVADRLVAPGCVCGQLLTDTYHAMNVFAFASHSETQGMVLAEAMAAGVPVVAVDAPGAREVVRDHVNGRLLMDDDERMFAEALAWCEKRSRPERDALRSQAIATADAFSMPRCIAQLERLYCDVIAQKNRESPRNENAWLAVVRLLEEEWKLFSCKAAAVGQAILGQAGEGDAVDNG